MQQLQEAALKNGPLCVGLDTDPSYLPESVLKAFVEVKIYKLIKKMEKQEIEEKVRAFFIDDLEIEEEKIFPDSRLKEDMGIDSLDYVDIVAVVLSTFGVRLNLENMKEVKTLSQFIDYLDGELKKKQ